MSQSVILCVKVNGAVSVSYGLVNLLHFQQPQPSTTALSTQCPMDQRAQQTGNGQIMAGKGKPDVLRFSKDVVTSEEDSSGTV